jgi:uncharacterized protein (TIGR01244 family)
MTRRLANRTAIVVAVVCLATAVAAEEKAKTPKVTAADLGKTPNVHACGALLLAGQPEPGDIGTIKARGIERVITLRTDGEIDWDEAAALKETGIELIQVPFRSPDSLNDKVFDQIRKLLKDPQPTLLHCGSANRVGAVWLTHRVLDQGVPLETALEEAKTIGLRSEDYEAKARDYIQRHAK